MEQSHGFMATELCLAEVVVENIDIVIHGLGEIRAGQIGLAKQAVA